MPVLAAGLRFYNTLLLVPTMFTLRATIDLNEISSRRKLCSIFYKIWPFRSLLTLLYVPRIKPVVRKKKAQQVRRVCPTIMPLPLAVRAGPLTRFHINSQKTHGSSLCIQLIDYQRTQFLVKIEQAAVPSILKAKKRGTIFTKKTKTYRDVVCSHLTRKGQRCNDP